MENKFESNVWEDVLTKIDWSVIPQSEKKQFNSFLYETSKVMINRAVIKFNYECELRALLLLMGLVIFMKYMNYSNNSIIVSMVLFQIIFSAFSGFISWGSSLLSRQAEENFIEKVNEYTQKYPIDQEENNG